MWGSAAIDTIVPITEVKAKDTEHRHKDTYPETCRTLDIKGIVLREATKRVGSLGKHQSIDRSHRLEGDRIA